MSEARDNFRLQRQRNTAAVGACLVLAVALAWVLPRNLERRSRLDAASRELLALQRQLRLVQGQITEAQRELLEVQRQISVQVGARN